MDPNLYISTLQDALPRAAILKTLYLTNHETEDFGEGFDQLIELKMLVLRGRKLRRLPESVARIPALETLYIEYCDELTEIPAAWFPMPALKSVFLNDLPRLEQVPAALGLCPQLATFTLWKTPRIRQLPPLPHLVSFAAHSLELTDLPAWLFDCTGLRTLTVEKCPLRELPAVVAQCTQLSYLRLEHTPINTLPDLRACTQLEKILVSNSPIAEIPDYWGELPHLLQLDATNCAATAAPWACLSGVAMMEIGFSSPNCTEKWHSYRTSAFLAALHKAKLPKTELLPLFRLYQKMQPMREASMRLLLATLCLNYEKYQDQGIESHKEAMAEIEQRGTEALKIKPLQKNNELAVLGKKLLFNRTELKQKLEQLGISYQAKIKKTTSHVVVGYNLNEKELEGCDRADLVFLSDRQLEQVLKTLEDRFLANAPAEESAPQNQNLSSLLLSRDNANVEIALQLLKAGGVPKELLTELFLVAKNPNLADKTRKAARQLAELNGSEALRKSLADKTSFWTILDDKLLQRRLQSSLSGTELDAAKVAEYLLVDNRNAYRYWFSVISADERRAETERQLADPNYTPYLFHIWYDYTNTYGGSGSQDLVPLQPKLKRLSLAYAPQRSVSYKIYEFKNLEYLNLKQNVLKKIPQELSYLRHLKELDISENYLEKFPEVLEQMTWLTTIHAKGNPFMSNGAAIPSCYESDDKGILTRKS